MAHPSQAASFGPADRLDGAETTGDVLRRYGRVLSRHRVLIVSCVLVALAAAAALTFLQQKSYRATTTLLVRESLASATDSATNRSDAQRLVDTEIEVLKSGSVTNEVEGRLGYQPNVSIATTGETDTIEISATAPSAARAASDANLYAQTYLDVSASRTVNDYTEASADAQAKIDGIDRRIAELQGAMADLDAQILGASSDERIELERRKRELAATTELEESTLREQRTNYVQERDRLEVAASLSGRDGPEVIGEATPPGSPASPDPVRNLALAGVLGLLLGIGAAFLRETLDETLKTKSDLERAAPALTVVGLVPAPLPGRRNRLGRREHAEARPPAELISVTEPHSPTAEAYRTLRTSVQFLGVDRRIGTLQVTSPQEGEGKTTTAANLAVAFARSGLRVVVVCCDWRRPQLHSFFGIENRAGFTSVMVGDMPLSGAMVNVPGLSKLVVLPAGPTPPNPSELLSTARAREIISTLQKSADMLILDTPPVVPVSDAIIVSEMADAVLLVTRSGVTTRHGLRRALDLLEQVDAPLMGAVLLGVTAADAYGTDVSYSSRPGPRVSTNGHGRPEVAPSAPTGTSKNF